MANPRVLGQLIPDFVLPLRRNGKHGIILDWFQDEAQTIPSVNLSGTVMQIIVGERDAPVAMYVSDVLVGNRAVWHFSQVDTDLEFDTYDGLILLIDGADETPMANLKIVVDPG